ncbi:hypothetical protein DENSPDRAFT_310505 [Dentipellis sp. KUC8613]|nr:hypothetical protein DENSPDRAFT_310505 [Dentipellis sp. KUC8613]
MRSELSPPRASSQSLACALTTSCALATWPSRPSNVASWPSRPSDAPFEALAPQQRRGHAFELSSRAAPPPSFSRAALAPSSSALRLLLPRVSAFASWSRGPPPSRGLAIVWCSRLSPRRVFTTPLLVTLSCPVAPPRRPLVPCSIPLLHFCAPWHRVMPLLCIVMLPRFAALSTHGAALPRFSCTPSPFLLSPPDRHGMGISCLCTAVLCTQARAALLRARAVCLAPHELLALQSLVMPLHLVHTHVCLLLCFCMIYILSVH